jgi:hypothetical protein
MEAGKTKGRSKSREIGPVSRENEEGSSAAGADGEREASPRDVPASLSVLNDVDAITPQERRRAFEDLRAAAACPQVDLDGRLFDVLARDVAEPRGEVFLGEVDALVALLVEGQDGQSFPSRVLAQAAIEVAKDAHGGTRAGRVALLRAVASFLLHDRVTHMAVRSKDCRQPR